MSIQYEQPIKPEINFKHIDGPILTCSYGSIHFLDLIERIQLKIKMITLNDLNIKYTDDKPQQGN